MGLTSRNETIVFLRSRPPTSRLLQWLALALILGTLLLGFLGTGVEFVRSDAWRGTGEIVVLLLAAWPSWQVARILDDAQIPNSRGHTRRSRLLLCWMVGPVIVYGFFWMAYVVAVPDLITRTWGQPFTKTYVLSAEYRSTGRRLCRHRVHGPPFDDRPLHGYYCASRSEFAQLPRSGPMTVLGRKTWFGRHFEKIAPADTP